MEFLRAFRRQSLHGHAGRGDHRRIDDSPLMAEARALGVAAVVKKPWSPQALRSVVQQVIDSSTG